MAEPRPLSVRQAQQVIGSASTTEHRGVDQLRADGLLELVNLGERASHSKTAAT